MAKGMPNSEKARKLRRESMALRRWCWVSVEETATGRVYLVMRATRPSRRAGLPFNPFREAMLLCLAYRGYRRRRCIAYSTAIGNRDSTTIARMTHEKCAFTAGMSPKR